MDVAALKAFEVHDFNKFLRNFLAFLCWYTHLSQTELDIVLHIEPGKKGGFLEKQDTVSSRSFHFFPISPDGTTAGLFETSDNTQQCGFTTTARSEETDELARSNF